MWKKSSTIQGEEGFVLVTSLLVMMLVVTVGIMTTTTSTVEMQISGADKFHQISFFGGDSGVYTTPKLITQANADLETPVNGNFDVISQNFYEEIKGLQDPVIPDVPLDLMDPDGPKTDHQLEFEIFGVVEGAIAAKGTPADVVVDIQNLGSRGVAGGGVEFASGVEGANNAGAKINYLISSTGSAPKTSVNIQAVYFTVPNTTGGL